MNLRNYLLLTLLLLTALFGTSQAQVVTNGGPIPVTSAAQTYYVCAKANGGTCVYNGDAGTVAATIADTNDCTGKATPCRTIDGVRAKLAGNIINSIVTIQLADSAGTGTDCYRPNNTIFQNHTTNAEVDTALEMGERDASSGTYPASYLYLLGNTTTPGNVLITGATTCSGTTATDLTGLRFSNTTVRIRGIQAQYFKGGVNGPDNGAFQFYNSNVFAEDLNYTGDTTTTGTLLVGWRSIIRLGSSLQWTVTSGGVVDAVNLSHVSFLSPLGRSNIAVTLGSGWTASGGIFTSNEKSHMGIDGASITVTGSGTARIWFAIAQASITWNDALTFTAPSQTHSYNGAGITLLDAEQGGYISDLCRTVGQLTCNIGNTTSISKRATAGNFSTVRYLTAGTSSNADTPSADSVIQGAVRTMYVWTATTFANLGTPANGSFVYCSDCTFANPCAGSGTGALAKRLNGAWRCD